MDIKLRQLRFRKLRSKYKGPELARHAKHFDALVKMYSIKTRLSSFYYNSNPVLSDTKLKEAEDILTILDAFLNRIDT